MRNVKRNRIAAAGAVAAASLLLASCMNGGDAGPVEETAPPSPTAAAEDTVTSSPETTSSNKPSTTSSTSSSETESETESAGTGDIDEVQIVIETTREVSPGVLQYSNYGEASGKIVWQALSGGAFYSGERCAAVVTLTDPQGTVLLTDRKNTCDGKTSFDLRPSKNPTGEYTINVSIAPWDDPDNAVEGSSTFEMIAYGS